MRQGRGFCGPNEVGHTLGLGERPYKTSWERSLFVGHIKRFSDRKLPEQGEWDVALSEPGICGGYHFFFRAQFFRLKIIGLGDINEQVDIPDLIVLNHVCRRA